MITRRTVLGGLFGCGITVASPKLTLAQAATDNRLVVIILRGAMDSLEAIQPYGDPAFHALRGDRARTPDNGLIDLDGHFGVREELADLAALYRKGEMAIVHSVSTPYRSRSHFEGQDILETGGEGRPENDGWLNRLLTKLPEGQATALDVSDLPSLILSGEAPVRSWRPNTRVSTVQENARWLQALYHDDATFSGAFAEAMAAADDESGSEEADRVRGLQALADLAGRALADSSRIAVFSLPAWDTHIGQDVTIRAPLKSLNVAVTTLRDRLGPDWARTTVVAVSEFGRTVRLNGNLGTDHGTGGAMIVAGGAIAGGAGGKVLTTRWPGLAEGNLLDDRDLMPTDDVRRYLGWLIRDMFEVSPQVVAETVFPGVELGSPVRFL